MGGQPICPLFVSVREEDFDATAEVEKLRAGRMDIGAIVTFSGALPNRRWRAGRFWAYPSSTVTG
jgi:molybdopterin synthase catalytic subunit